MPVDRSPPLDAVIFDMDGVITDTASAHATAWKRLFDDYLRRRAERRHDDFVPFDIERDYRRHVDGVPRYDGVRRFLASRGIELPEGSPDDEPDRETVCGLGNRKNGYFRDWLAENRVRVYPTTLFLLRALAAAGIKRGVFSASRNCGAVLDNAGVSQWFDTRVDGGDLARLDLPGKPDPAMILEAAARLDVDPSRAAVIEDSAAGVEAGAAGGFSWVVGINRGDYAALLADAGAHAVVADLGELKLDDDRLATRRLDHIPSVWAHWPDIRARLEKAHPAFFLDYDGTLTPIVEDPDRADLSDAMRETLAMLAQRYPVAVISGRGADELRRRVGLDNLVYAGSHGFEMRGPDFSETAAGAERFLPALEDAEQRLRQSLADIAGHLVERKPFAVAVHYRRVDRHQVQAMGEIVDAVLQEYPELRKNHGKKVFQVQPRLDWDKGRAVAHLRIRLGLDGDEVLPVYIGDDLTDENAFRVLKLDGIGIAVRDGSRPTTADYALADPADVARLFAALLQRERS